jgi:3-phosphoshikimate 1-carboxyvinyltransferase
MIDEFPVFAVAACFASGVTEVYDAEELRYKETDRISVLCGELKALGVRVSERRDGFTIEGGTLAGGEADARGDHRLAMSLALAGLAAPSPVKVRHAEILRSPSLISSNNSCGSARPGPQGEVMKRHGWTAAVIDASARLPAAARRGRTSA